MTETIITIHDTVASALKQLDSAKVALASMAQDMEDVRAIQDKRKCLEAEIASLMIQKATLCEEIKSLKQDKANLEEEVEQEDTPEDTQQTNVNALTQPERFVERFVVDSDDDSAGDAKNDEADYWQASDMVCEELKETCELEATAEEDAPTANEDTADAELEADHNVNNAERKSSEIEPVGDENEEKKAPTGGFMADGQPEAAVNDAHQYKYTEDMSLVTTVITLHMESEVAEAKEYGDEREGMVEVSPSWEEAVKDPTDVTVETREDPNDPMSQLTMMSDVANINAHREDETNEAEDEDQASHGEGSSIGASEAYGCKEGYTFENVYVVGRQSLPVSFNDFSVASRTTTSSKKRRRVSEAFVYSPKKWRRMIRTNRLKSILLSP